MYNVGPPRFGFRLGISPSSWDMPTLTARKCNSTKSLIKPWTASGLIKGPDRERTAANENSGDLNPVLGLFSEHRRGLDVSGCPEVVGMKKSNKNCPPEDRWKYTGSILEGKTEMPVF